MRRYLPSPPDNDSRAPNQLPLPSIDGTSPGTVRTHGDFPPGLNSCNASDSVKDNGTAQGAIDLPYKDSAGHENYSSAVPYTLIGEKPVEIHDTLHRVGRREAGIRQPSPKPSMMMSTLLQTKCTDVLYMYYSFLSLGNLSNLAPTDVNILSLQGCLRVPTREILDEFLRQYFRRVYPSLPMVDEGEFWARFTGEGSSNTCEGGISLLLLQAMMFASCNVCQHEYLHCTVLIKHSFCLCKSFNLWLPVDNCGQNRFIS